MKRTFDITSPIVHGGFGFYWAWVAVAFYSSAPVAYSSLADNIVESFWQYSTMAHGVVILLCALAAPRIGSLVQCPGAPLVSGISLSMGMLFLVLLSTFGDAQISQIALIVVSIFVGAVSSLHFLMWGETYARIGVEEMTACSLLSFGMGLMLYFVLADYYMMAVGAIASVALPTLSAICLYASLRRNTESAHEPANDFGRIEEAFEEGVASSVGGSCCLPSAESVVWEQTPRLFDSAILTLALFAFAFSGEMLRGLSIALSNTTANIMGSFYLFGGILGLSGLTWYWLAPLDRSGSPRDINMRVVRAVLIIMSIAFLAIPFVSSYSIAVGYGIFGAGFWCFRVISWIYCLLFVRRFSTNSLRAVGILDGAFALSVLASAPVNTLLVNNLRQSGATLTTISLVVALVLTFIVVFVLYNRQSTTVLNVHETEFALSSAVAPARRSVSSAEENLEVAYDERMRVVAAAYGLTDREVEVARLMAQGRSLPFIQEALFISAGTAQTHSRHIYKKLGIHSRQELIDIVKGDKQK